MKTRRAQNKLRLVTCAAAIGLLAGSAVRAEDAPAPSGTAELPADLAAQQFTEACSGCHSIGGGALRGPDLAGVAAWPDAQLSAAIRTMERKVGPLTVAQVDGLTALLKDTTLRDRLGKAKAKLTRGAERPDQPANSLVGGALFFGHAPLENRGMACSSCHRFRGEGGDLGPELSRFAGDAELEVLAGTIARAAFPVMRASYQTQPITQQEARHLAAFMKQAKSQRIVAAFSATTLIGMSFGVGLFAFVVALIFNRPRGVRARLIQRATKR